jgi:hypothetical protein
MKSFYEAYQDVDAARERERVRGMNMTSKLPVGGKPALNAIRELTRGFHLNTIISRMFQPWVSGFEHAPIRYDLLETRPDAVYQYRISEKDKRGNDKYKAAYELFKQEMANAVAALPEKKGFDIISGRDRDIMHPTKQFFKGVGVEERDLIESVRRAFKIFWAVFGETWKSGIRDYINFFEIVKEEFMRLGERLPTMGDGGGEMSSSPYIALLDNEIKKYRELEEK